MNINVDVRKAEGSYIYTSSVFGKLRKKLDCVGSGGCNVFGHNREDLIYKVLDKHSAGFDYFAQLNEKMYGATGLEKMFQAVSGASAVESGLIMSLLAAAPKKKIVIFKGNFGGKTLAALNVTAANHYYFNPVYKDIKIIDPHAANAVEETTKLLTSGEVAIVWMEVIQGRTLQAVPENIISLVNEYREQYNYFVGIDEILNGINRTGNFTSYDPALIRPDIITFAKGFSGMVMPVSIVMISDEVYKRARIKNEEAVQFLENLYKNQLSCHIAMHVMDKLVTERIPENVAELSIYLKEGITSVAAKTPLIRNIETHGLHIHVNVDLKKFPFKYFGYDRSNFILTELFYTKGNFMSLFGRLLPPLNLRKDEARQVIAGMEYIFSRHPLLFFWVGMKQNVYRIFRMLLQKISR
jgi:acetylornithine/succinyldiaminopimelate/putrescine aminotransferase